MPTRFTAWDRWKKKTIVRWRPYLRVQSVICFLSEKYVAHTIGTVRSETFRENGNEDFYFFQNKSRLFIPMPYSTPVHAYVYGREGWRDVIGDGFACRCRHVAINYDPRSSSRANINSNNTPNSEHLPSTLAFDNYNNNLQTGFARALSVLIHRDYILHGRSY